jgi:metallophosphoesterase superfamily enzyme
LTFGTIEHSPARMENGVGAWFGVEDAALLIADLHKAIEAALGEKGEYLYYGRTVKITDMKNGRYVYETDCDESGYVTAGDCADAITKVNNQIRRVAAIQW